MTITPEYHREWRKRNPGKQAEADRRYHAKLTEEQRERRRAASRRHYRSKGKFRQYGITAEDFDQMMTEQGDACLTCSRPAVESRGGQLVIDHCHASGKVRGLLCHNCNVVLGLVSERREVLQALMDLL